MLRQPLRHWLSLRIRLVCITVFVAGSLLPPYVPKEALAQQEGELPAETPQFMLVEDGFLMKSSSLTQQGARRAYAEGLIHVVAEGESFERIAQKYRISVNSVRWANNLTESSTLRPGQELVILPVDGVLHTVSRGQTLLRIAELYSIPADKIAEQNSIQGGFILAGQQIIIPGGSPIVAKPAVIAAKPPVVTKPGAPKPSVPSTGGTPTGAAAVSTFGVLQMPCNSCTYTQYYHPGHYAVDIQQRGGGPIFAAEAGTVVRADLGWNGGYGNVIEVDHGNGLITLYAHNKTLYVKEGDTVTRGQEISFMGNTGRVYGKTGIHVHFEVQVNGVKKNPTLYLQ